LAPGRAKAPLAGQKGPGPRTLRAAEWNVFSIRGVRPPCCAPSCRGNVEEMIPIENQFHAGIRESRGGSPKHMKVLFMAAAFPP
jgi:hypothetical protein